MNRLPHPRQRAARQPVIAAPQCGQAVRSGSPLATANLKTGPRSMAPTGTPARAPAAVQTRFTTSP
jgi:hypothetical protein